jgi:hypothetical protein
MTMALKQVEDDYNNATPLERAARWPSTDREKDYARLQNRLQQAQQSRRGQVDEHILEHAIEQTRAKLRDLGVSDK